MAKTAVTVGFNDLLLVRLSDYCAGHELSLDFVLAVAADQFLDSAAKAQYPQFRPVAPVVPGGRT